MTSAAHELEHDAHTHPGTMTYWIIGGILFVITALEIGAYYVEESLGALVTPIILALSAAKFILVVMFYMHLKYDSKIFTSVFLFPLTLAALVISGLILLYHVLHPLR